MIANYLYFSSKLIVLTLPNMYISQLFSSKMLNIIYMASLTLFIAKFLTFYNIKTIFATPTTWLKI